MTAPLPLAFNVSFDDEPLVLVDADDNVMGFADKAELHRGRGLRHRAFSIFLSSGNRILMHRRSALKPLWPGYWTNSCCSHPRQGEDYGGATRRRLREELGVTVDLRFLYRFEYRADFIAGGAEHELCSVFLGELADASSLQPNPSEIAAWGWFDVGEIDEWVDRRPTELTPWFLLEWPRVRPEILAQAAR
jgi:isopentenyl-diphosphate delta-isomerase